MSRLAIAARIPFLRLLLVRWVRVEWYTGATNSYRMGKEGQYDLQLADSALNVASPTEPEREELGTLEPPPSSESHPTKLLRHCAAKLLQILAVGSGLHGAHLDKYALRGITSMFRAMLDPKPALANVVHCLNWLNLGFIRAIAGAMRCEYIRNMTYSISVLLLLSGDCPRLCLELSAPNWLSHYFALLEQPAGTERGVYRQLHCLRLLQCILSSWGVEQEPRMPGLVRQLFGTLGRIALHCPGDATLQPMQEGGKARVLLTASHSGSVAEELVALLRRLHTLPHWNAVINSFLAQKLCVAAELLQGESQLPQTPLDTEHSLVLGVLSAMGGYDLRPRVGLHCFHEGSHMIIASFTHKGRCLLAYSAPPAVANLAQGLVKVPLGTVLPQLDHSVFSLTRLPMNEMLLNAWTVLLYGAASASSSSSAGNWELLNAGEGKLDVRLLRSQQLQLAVLHTNGVLYRHQAALRKILKQRAPASVYSSSECNEEAEVEPLNEAEQVLQTAQTEAHNGSSSSNNAAIR